MDAVGRLTAVRSARAHGPRRRILLEIEEPGPAWCRVVAGLIATEGHDVALCHGPRHRSCPLVEEGACPMAEWADVIVTSLDLDDAGNRAVVSALPAAYPSTPVVALVSSHEAIEYRRCLSGFTVECFPMSARDLFSLIAGAPRS